MDDSSWKYDSYEDHSDLSGMLATNRDSISEEEQEIVHDDGKVTFEFPNPSQVNFFSLWQDQNQRLRDQNQMLHWLTTRRIGLHLQETLLLRDYRLLLVSLIVQIINIYTIVREIIVKRLIGRKTEQSMYRL